MFTHNCIYRYTVRMRNVKECWFIRCWTCVCVCVCVLNQHHLCLYTNHVYQFPRIYKHAHAMHMRIFTMNHGDSSSTPKSVHAWCTRACVYPASLHNAYTSTSTPTPIHTHDQSLLSPDIMVLWALQLQSGCLPLDEPLLSVILCVHLFSRTAMMATVFVTWCVTWCIVRRPCLRHPTRRCRTVFAYVCTYIGT